MNMSTATGHHRLGQLIAGLAVIAAWIYASGPAFAVSQPSTSLSAELEQLEVELSAELTAELSLTIAANPAEFSSVIQGEARHTEWEDVLAQENAYLYEEHLQRQRKAMIVGLSAGAAAAAVTALAVCIHDDDEPGCPDNTPLWTLGVGVSVGIVSGLIAQYTGNNTSLSQGDAAAWNELEQIEAESIALSTEVVAEILQPQVDAEEL